MGRSVMASLIGASIWGIGVLLVLLRTRIKEVRLKKNLTYIAGFLFGIWIGLWLVSANESVVWAWNETGLRLLTIGHASLLTAGFGMTLVLLVSSIAWLLKERGLKNKKSQRWLPSLEGLAKASHISLRASIWFWTTGLFFAILAALIRWQRVHDVPAFGALIHYEWLSDPKVILSIALWIPLVLCRLFRGVFSEIQKARYQSFAVMALLFVMIFLFMSSTELPFSRHEALRWITR
ncbi:hypothetical protein GW915_05045 [bacterium]|nr:hypothetical protein [bacterium]